MVESLLDRDKLREQLLREFDQVVAEVADAVDEAPVGRVIRDSEEEARDALDRFRRAVYEQALQGKIEAAEAAFPPPVSPASGKTKRHKGRQAYSVLTINGLMQYAAERNDIIRYPDFRKKHWQIGSGPTEAECKTTTQRVKGRGRRWDSANAEAMMALAALHDSGLWHQRWTSLDPQRN